MSRAEQRMLWLLRLIAKKHFGGLVAWDEEVVDSFTEAFPETEKRLIIFTMGPNSSPMLNAAAIRARDLGLLSPGVVGNQDARSFNQRTWCRYWTITDAGRLYVQQRSDQ